MTIELIRPGAHREAPVLKPLVSRDCGPEGCEVDWLASRRHEAELDIEDFTAFSMSQGWGDGLPLVPPTDARVRTFLSENDRYPDEVVATLPGNVECTVEKLVINAVMAGAPAASLELLIAMVTSVADPDFELYGFNATTASVYPAFVVNGSGRGSGWRLCCAGSIVACTHSPARTRFANRRSCPIVRPRSPSRRACGSPVSAIARSIRAGPRSAIAAAAASRKSARVSGSVSEKPGNAASASAQAASTSPAPAEAKAGSRAAPVAASTARNVSDVVTSASPISAVPRIAALP